MARGRIRRGTRCRPVLVLGSPQCRWHSDCVWNTKVCAHAPLMSHFHIRWQRLPAADANKRCLGWKFFLQHKTSSGATRAPCPFMREPFSSRFSLVWDTGRRRLSPIPDICTAWPGGWRVCSGLKTDMCNVAAHLSCLCRTLKFIRFQRGRVSLRLSYSFLLLLL